MHNPLLTTDICRRFAMPKRIAVATDLTDSATLLPYAIAQARVTGAHLCLIHVIHARVGGVASTLLSRFHDRHSSEDEAMDRLEDMQRMAQLKGVCCSIQLLHGEPAKSILDSLHKTPTDRLIVGSHGRRHLREVLHGSVARQLMATATIPTLFVGPNVYASRPPDMNSILCLVPLEGEYEKVARFGLLIAEMHQARVTLMHILQDSDTDAIDRARTEKLVRNALQGIIHEFGRREYMATVEVRRGPMVETTCRAAEELLCDVVVLGTCAPTHSHHMKDLLAYQLMTTLNCPVYCYRPRLLEQFQMTSLEGLTKSAPNSNTSAGPFKAGVL